MFGYDVWLVAQYGTYCRRELGHEGLHVDLSFPVDAADVTNGLPVVSNGLTVLICCPAAQAGPEFKDHRLVVRAQANHGPIECTLPYKA